MEDKLRITPVFSIHDLPTNIADIIDVEWLSPICIMTKGLVNFDVTRDDLVCKEDGLQLYIVGPEIDDTEKYRRKYDCSYYVTMDIGERQMDHPDMEIAIDFINKHKSKTIFLLSITDYYQRFMYFKRENEIEKWLDKK